MTPGKIILSGEYAVVFGYPGMAVPARACIVARMSPSARADQEIRATEWTGLPANAQWIDYLNRILELCKKYGSETSGISIENSLPLGKGMGASTALVVAVSKCLLGPNCKEKALEIENTVNPDHSGLDFEVIWNNAPILFQKDQPTRILDKSIYRGLENHFHLIDTGQPDQTTPELVAWVRFRKRNSRIAAALETIGRCTERLLAGESPLIVLPDHHRAQVALGIVPKHVQILIHNIEKSGGAAKVIGAGSRTGGGGVVLVLAKNARTLAASYGYSLLHTQHRLHQILGK